MNGQPVHSNGRIEIKDNFNFLEKDANLGKDQVGSMLVLLNSVIQDSGLYQCQAENEAGQASATARLHVQPSGE